MAAQLEITCPNCRKQFKVPAEFVGKLIRCKDCQTAFEVSANPSGGPARPAAAKPAAAKPAAPAAAKPAKPAAPVAAKPAEAKPADAPIPFKEDPPPAPKKAADDDDEDANPYGVIKESDVPRCPFCAKELDPPDTKICLNCGYDLLQRRRHESKKVYETTKGDYTMHLLPGILCAIAAVVILVVAILASVNMRGWMTGSFLDSDEKNPITGQTIFYVGPLCFNIWIWVISIWLIFLTGRFAVRRLILNWKPAEVIKKS